MRDEAAAVADEARLAQQLAYLDGWPEAQRAAREAFERKCRRRRMREAAGQDPVTLAQYAQLLTELPERDLPLVGRLLATMLDDALLAQDALTQLAVCADQLGELTAGLPPIEDFPAGPKLVAAVGEFANHLVELADMFGERMAARTFKVAS